MSRILAIDYGLKRVGLAVTDPLQIIASALTAVEEKKLFAYLDAYLKKESVETIVVGFPLKNDGTETHATAPVKKFIPLLQSRYPSVKVVTADERFTSKMARQALVDMGMRKKQREKKENTDQVSAVIILQTYLESIRFT